MIDLERGTGIGRDAATVIAGSARDRRRVWLASGAWSVLWVTSVVFLFVPRPRATAGLADHLYVLFDATFPIAAIAILARQPRNRVGWILMAIGLAWSVGTVLENYGDLALGRGLPGGALCLALAAPLWAPPIVLMGTTLLLRFPDGGLLAPRWRLVERLGLVAMAMALVVNWFGSADLAEVGYPNVANPLAIPALSSVLEFATVVVLGIPLVLVASAVCLVLRFRRSSGVERLQLKWLVAAGAVVATIYAIAIVLSIDTGWFAAGTPVWVAAIQLVALLSFVLFPISIVVAIQRYRLYGIDVLITKAVVYGTLAAFITGAYVGIVVGIGHVLGRSRDVGLSIAATAVVAVAFQPVRERVQRFANQLVYGRRAAPYDVLSHLSGRMTGAFETEDVLPRVARLLVEGTGAAHVDIWLRVRDRLRLGAGWPHDAHEPARLDLVVVGDDLPKIEDASVAVPVRDGGELLGAIAVREAPGDPITPPERALAEDVARQAALLLRNARLIEELRASRERIVAAQDDERRRLERDIHDGAQQEIVTLSLATRLAQSELGPDAPPALREMLERAVGELKDALAELRELARGIHPRILTERGLGAAVRFLAERSPVPVEVDVRTNGNLPDPVEVTAYFAVSEALTNVAKYANATSARIIAEQTDHSLLVLVEDDGVGGADTSKGTGLRGLVDRVAAVGGELHVDSPAGRGTRLTVRLPAGER